MNNTFTNAIKVWDKNLTSTFTFLNELAKMLYHVIVSEDLFVFPQFIVS